MSSRNPKLHDGELIDERVFFTLVEFSSTCGVRPSRLVELVLEGVLAPVGEVPERWLFDGSTLKRARIALRLSRDLQINPPGVAIVLDLLDQIESLETRLRRSSLD